MDRVLNIGTLQTFLKVFVAISLMILAMGLFIASINQAMAASLRSHVTVTEGNITLGDVFEEIEENADFVLAPAPQPGVTLVWDARTLKRIVKAFDLPWTVKATDQTTIRRLANIITSDMIKDAVMDSLKEKGTVGNFDLEFLNRASSHIILPHDIEPSVTVTSASYNMSRQTFSATLRTADNTVTQVTGIMHPLVQIPVLKLGARRGETISRNDITMIDMREDMVTENMVVSANEIIGMTPRKVLRAKTPVDVKDLDKPVMVKRGELVTMNLRRGAIQVTALAKALEAGTEGDIIRLMNIDSKRTIEAEITGLREASVLF